MDNSQTTSHSLTIYFSKYFFNSTMEVLPQSAMEMESFPDVEALSGSSTVATLLPTAELCTRSPFPDARRLIDAGVTVALASDCNPGSSYTTSMPLAISLGVIAMKMTCDEALWAATAGGAAALRRSDVGLLRPGSRADLVVLDAASHIHLAYRPGVAQIGAVVFQFSSC